MREEGSIQVAETVAGNRHVVRGIVCAQCGIIYIAHAEGGTPERIAYERLV